MPDQNLSDVPEAEAVQFHLCSAVSCECSTRPTTAVITPEFVHYACDEHHGEVMDLGAPEDEPVSVALDAVSAVLADLKRHPVPAPDDEWTLTGRRAQFDAQARAEVMVLVESLLWGDVDTLDVVLERLLAVTADALPANYMDLDYRFIIADTPEQIANLTAEQRAEYVAQQIRDLEIMWNDNGTAKIIRGLLHIAGESAARRDV
jgi:hypothetical protein